MPPTAPRSPATTLHSKPISASPITARAAAAGRGAKAMQIAFVTVDVFTDRKFGGNPLAVVPDATALTGTQMQAIASEFNLAEATFVLPPQDRAHTAQVRIFTPRAELPFAGHPNIGTAYVLAKESERVGGTVNDPIIFEEKAGL